MSKYNYKMLEPKVRKTKNNHPLRRGRENNDFLKRTENSVRTWFSFFSPIDTYIEPNQQVNEPEKGPNKKEQDSAGGDEKTALEARVQSLKQTIFSLKSELLEEKALWRKEVDFMTNLISTGERSLEPDLISEAEVLSEMKSVMSIPVVPPDPVATSPLIRDYEEKLNRYQGALAQAQAEKRLNIRRQIAANTYRKRLNEVEKLCQEELDKVRETATYLEPLKQIASEWGKVKQHYVEPVKSPSGEKPRRRSSSSVECGGDFVPARREPQQAEEQDSTSYEVPVKQIDASLVMDEDASNEIKGKIVLQIGSLPSEVPTICYSAKFE